MTTSKKYWGEVQGQQHRQVIIIDILFTSLK